MAKNATTTASLVLFLVTILVPIANAANGGPDAYGYSYSDISGHATLDDKWVEISSTGTEVISSGNNASSVTAAPIGIGAPVQLGHPFTFYGKTYTQLVPAIDGYISTDPSDLGLDNTYDCPLPALPSSGGGGRIYPYHQNLEITSGGGVFYQYFKQSPHPYATCGVSVFTWKNVRRSGSSDSPTSFQALLFDTGDIIYQYDNPNTVDFGDDETIGIQNPKATSGLAYGCPTPLQHGTGNEAILFELSVNLSTNVPNSIANAPAGGKITYSTATSFNHVTPGWENLNLTIDKPLTIVGADVAGFSFNSRYGVQARNCTITIDGALVTFLDACFQDATGVTFNVINGGHLHLCDSSVFGSGTNAIVLSSGTTLTLRRSEVSNPAPHSGSLITAGPSTNISLFKSIVSESYEHGIEMQNTSLPQNTHLIIDRSSIVRNRQSGLFLRYARSRITQSNLTDNLGSGIVADRSHTTISNSNITTNKNIGLKLTGPGELYFDHSILAGNTSAQSGVIQNVDFSNKTDAFTIGSNICDTDPPFLSSASDKTLADPKLTPLAGYGENIGSPSPLATSNLLCQLPLHNSPAIDASQSPIQIDTTGTDLRGTPRIEDGDNNGSASLDSGAVEALPFVTVNTTADENSSPPGANTSLREALGLSQPHRIVFATSLNGQTINLSSNAGGQGVTLHRTHRHAVVDASMLSSSITVSGNGDMTQPLIGPQAYHGVTFANGRASVARIFSGTLILTHCHLNSNSQQANTNPLSYDQNGGAIFNAGSAYIIDTTFSGNHCVNEDNSAASGGAYASFPHEGAVFGKPIVTNYLIRCKFLNNVADSNAGAIYIAGGRKAIVDSCIISGNQANNIGGVSLLASQFDSSYVELTRTSVIRNRAENNSGVVLNGASAIGSGVPERIERITMSYCTVSGNSGSSSSRGAVSTSGVNLTIDHSTIVNNTGEFQAGISLRDSSTVNIRNSIVHNNLINFNNQLSPSNLDFDSSNNAFVSEGYNLSGNSMPNLDHPQDLTNTPPRLSPLSNTLANVPTHHPLHGSPAINAASAEHAAIDARGYPGKQGLVPDIGAVEAATPIVVTVYDDQFDTPTGSAVSLREALRDARDGSLITFSPTLAFNVIDLSTSAFGQGTPLESSKNIIIDATMLASGVTVKGPGSGLRCLTLPDGPQTFSLHGISFRDGQGSTNGSAIYKGLETDLTITHSAVYNCISTNAAGAVHANGGYLTMQNVTLYNNGSVRGGSAISARNKAEVTLEHTTVYGNTISTTNFPGGAAVFLESNANLNCNHVAFGDNLNTQTNSVRNLLRFGPATFGVPIFTIADDTTAPATSRVPALHLKPLQDSGGLAHTCPPEGNSPVVNGGYSIFAGSPLTDARGFARKYGPRVDVGAYELGSFVTGTMNPPVDNDNDGMDDHWEEYYGLLFEAPGDDNDNDNLTNLGEYLSQTDPTSFDSIVPTKIIKLEEVPNNAGYSLTFSSSPGIAYEVWYSPDLSANSFIYLFTTNGRAQADETQAIIAPTSYGSGTKAFFRIQRP